MTTTLVGPLPIVLCQTILPPDVAHMGRLLFVGGRKDLPAGRNGVDGRGYADIRHELHHDFDEFFPRDAAAERAADMGSELRRRGPERCQRRAGTELPRPPVQYRVLVDFSVDRLKHVSVERRSAV